MEDGEAAATAEAAPVHRKPPPPPEARQTAYDYTTCATLISCFDFAHRGFVERAEWRRGCQVSDHLPCPAS